MIRYKCAKCGGDLETLGDGRKAMCSYCNSVMVLPTLDPEVFNRANQLRMEQSFDLAEMEFERIVGENPKDSESYWNLVLCRFGIEYVKDKDETMVPTCHRMSYNSILDDPDYKRALEYADGYSYRLYQDEAGKIDRVLKRIVNIAQTQPPYDIFISYKETDARKQRTEDSVIAQDIYDALMEKHPELKIFLSRITLKEQAAGLEYEPIIFSALNTAKVMILVGTSTENLESTWVRNEWSRYRKMMDANKEKKMAVVFKYMNPSKDFPKELRLFSIQATEAVGFYQQDLIAGIENLLDLKKQGAMQYDFKQLQVAGGRQLSNFLKRASQSRSATEARSYFQKVLDIDAECVAAWWGLFKLDTENLKSIDKRRPFFLNAAAQNEWDMVQQYAKGAEKEEFDSQYREYQERWNKRHAAYQKEMEEEAERKREAENAQAEQRREAENAQRIRDAERKAKEAAKKVNDTLYKINEKTNNGLLFDDYKEIKSTLGELYSIADEKQTGRLRSWEEQYDRNHQKYVELQNADLAAAVKSQPDYRAASAKKETAYHTLSSAKRGLTGIFLVNVLIVVVAAILTLLSKSGVAIVFSYHVIPFLVCVLTVSTVAGIFSSFKADAVNTSGGMHNEFECLLWAAVPALIGYFWIEHRIFREASVFDPSLKWTCIFSGLFYVLVAAVAIVFIFLIFDGLSSALIFLAVSAIILLMVHEFIGVRTISEDILKEIMPPYFDWLFIAICVAAGVRVLLYIINKFALAKVKKAQPAYDSCRQDCERVFESQLAEHLAPFKGYVDEKYIEKQRKTLVETEKSDGKQEKTEKSDGKQEKNEKDGEKT